jgi:hypothetical protein
MTNLVFRTALRPGGSPEDLFRGIGDMFNGMAHSATGELPFILKTGIHTQRELPGGEQAGFRAQGIPYRSALEATPLPGELRNPLNWYKYVGRALQGMETVFYRGAHDAFTRAGAMRLADERGMNSVDAKRFAEQFVYGTENDRQEAIAQADREQTRFGFSDAIHDQRVQELIDEKRFARAPELADEAHRFALHSVYRESPYGMLGNFARKLSEMRSENPAISLVTPFINLPANVANEFMNWTPIGILRGRDAFGGGTAAIEKLYKDVPLFQRLVKAGEEGPGGITSRELRDMSYEYMGKGVVGSLGILAGIGSMWMNRNNPNPFFAVNGAGPQDLKDRDALRAGGWQPYSVKVGDRYFSYEATPWKAALGIMGGAHDIMNYAKHPDPENFISDIAMAAFKDAANSITDSSFLQGLQTVLGASSTRGADAQALTDRFLSQSASAVAGIFYGGTGTRQIYKLLNPQQYEAKGLGEKIIQNIPVANDALLRPKLNVLGEPVLSSPLNRILPTLESHDPVWRFLDDHNVRISLPNASQKVDGVQLNAAELHDFIQTRGRNLREQIQSALTDGSFEGMDSEQRNQTVREMERIAGEAGKAEIQTSRSK